MSRITGLTALLTARKTAVIGAVRSRSSSCSGTASSVSNRTVVTPLTPIRIRTASTAPASVSQKRPDLLSWRGSGGASPDGRRRRRPRPGSETARDRAASPVETVSEVMDPPHREECSLPMLSAAPPPPLA